MNENIISEEELENIYPDIDHNLPSPTMNSYFMTSHHNNPKKNIDNPEYFLHYWSWIIRDHEVKNIQASPI